MEYWEFRIRIPRLKARFRLRTLILLMLIVSLMLSAYTIGWRSGFSQGQIRGEVAAQARMTTIESYNVTDLLQNRQFGSLANQIKASVTPEAWRGGIATMEFFPTNQALLVQHTGIGHAELRQFLKQLHLAVKNPPSP